MKEARFYFDKNNLDGNKVFLDGDEFRHLVLVLRKRVGDLVILFCGDGFDYYSKIAKISKKDAELEITKKVKNETESSVDLTIFQALAKGEKLSLIAQKLTEIGADELKIFSSKFCDVTEKTTKLARLDKIVISASKQCGRSKLMLVSDKVLSFSEMLDSFSKFDLVLCAYENEENLHIAKVLDNFKGKKVAVIIGPEGGFSPEEIDEIKKSGAKIVTLGKRILRTETAAIFCASAVISFLEGRSYES